MRLCHWLISRIKKIKIPKDHHALNSKTLVSPFSSTTSATKVHIYISKGTASRLEFQAYSVVMLKSTSTDMRGSLSVPLLLMSLCWAHSLPPGVLYSGEMYKARPKGWTGPYLPIRLWSKRKVGHVLEKVDTFWQAPVIGPSFLSCMRIPHGPSILFDSFQLKGWHISSASY